MKEDWHNKELQNGLGNYDSPIDLEGAWEALDAKRHPKKAKRRFAWLWLGVLCLLVVGGYYLLDNVNDEISVSEKVVVVNPDLKQESNVKLEAQNNTQLLSEYEAEIANELKGKNTKTLFERIDKTQVSQTEGNTKFLKGKTARYLLSGNVKSIQAAAVIDLEDKSQIQDPNLPVAIIKPTDFGIKTQTSKTNDQESKNNQESLNQNEKKVTTANESIIKNHSKIVEERSSSDSLLASAVAGEPDIVNDSIPNLDDLKNELGISFIAKSSIGISASYGFLTSGSVSKDEQSLDALAVDVFYEKEISSAFYFKTGISYKQYTNKLKVNEEYVYFETENDVILVNSYISGLEEEITGEVEVEYRATHNHLLYNRYSFVAVPILVGYKVNFAKRSKLKLETGISTSLFTSHSGNLYATGLIESLENIDGYNAKKIAVLQGLLGLQYEYWFGGKTYLFVGSQMGLDLNGGVGVEGIYGARFGMIGAMVGCRKEF